MVIWFVENVRDLSRLCMYIADQLEGQSGRVRGGGGGVESERTSSWVPCLASHE